MSFEKATESNSSASCLNLLGLLTSRFPVQNVTIISIQFSVLTSNIPYSLALSFIYHILYVMPGHAPLIFYLKAQVTFRQAF